MRSQVQSGANPKVSEILAVRSLFSGPPLGIRRMSVDQMVSYLPSSLTSHTNVCTSITHPVYATCYFTSLPCLSPVCQRHASPLLFLTPRLPGFLIGRRLNSHALELLQLDRALSRLGPHQLSESELRQVSRSTRLEALYVHRI